MSDEKGAGIEKTGCSRNRADDQLKQFIDCKKREVLKLESFLGAIDWENLTKEEEFNLSGIVDDVIKANHRHSMH